MIIGKFAPAILTPPTLNILVIPVPNHILGVAELADDLFKRN